MKKVSILLACLFAMSALFAQQQTAILVHHDNTFNAYYGINAFIQAHNAAQPGETICLSAGDYNSCNITKSLTIRGNGIDGPVAERTYLTNNFNQRIQDSTGTSNRYLDIEGVYIRGTLTSDSICEYITLNHCNIGCFYRWSGFPRRLTFINCIVKEINSIGGSANDSIYATCINSYVNNIQVNFNVHMFNCICYLHGADFDFYRRGIYQNCIIYGHPQGSYPPFYPYVYSRLDHCVVINTSDTNLFGYSSMHTGTNNVERTFSQVFTSFTGGDLDDQTSFALTANAQTTLLGSDSTQVGIYGGVRPWTDALTYPKITGMTVPHQTTGTGMLGVTVQIRQGE